MAANGGWPRKHRRIPAFGDWNYSYYPRDDDDDGVAGVDDWPAASVTPCFDFAPGAATMRTAARPADQHKFNKRSSMPNARRKRIPAFGEWNHHGDHGGNGVGNGIGIGTWPPAVMTPFFDLATPQKAAPNKTAGRRRRRRGGDDDDGFGAAKLATAAAEAPPQGHLQTRRSKVADSGSYAAAARRSCFTVAKPVDDDLYVVPPDMMLYGKPPGPRKDGWLRILRLLGCCSCLSPSY
ncbi:uncharacterized protein LOC110429863 [Sorghum bicolor]|uniref:Uncharacterized protein n=1 Tax=Sorghum bicolor TaxID=4558 RepID=A0A1B6PCA3_SORBI|nr:uncharacterized protein LOC110429863 [Sorghum bicolor]KXG23125.1 hypothetical protein SORBI_3008G059500 [Sorghum bicolor]|eukprot:XP_021302226.1 uncharacterized protein LOC110429863 [Sorghum bicolor]